VLVKYNNKIFTYLLEIIHSISELIMKM